MGSDRSAPTRPAGMDVQKVLAILSAESDRVEAVLLDNLARLDRLEAREVAEPAPLAQAA
jgi:hypothetical protein